MRLGVSYYPEHNPESRWGADLASIREAGIARVRVAEFAWSRMEPDNGRFEWGWLDRFLDLAGEYGLGVILCTPTASPPIWLVEQYPEVIPVDEEGRRNVFGARQHRCYNAPAYVRYGLRVVEELANRYGGHPSVVAWQLDNEYGGEQKRCHCDHCKLAFQRDLEGKFADIGELNARWGTVFWSMEYQRFSQIAPPMLYKTDLWLKNNPSLEMAYTRFCSDAIVRFSREQLALVRPRAGGRPITTNRFPLDWGDNVDWFDLVRELDVAGMDLYSEKLHEIAFYADFNESLKPGRSWFMEFGPNAANLADGMRQLHGRGVEWFTVFKFKPFPFGQEQSLKELVTTTGEPTDSYRHMQAWSGEERAGTLPPRFEASGIGLVFSFESSWAYTISVWGHQIHNRMYYPNYVVDVAYRGMYDERLRHRIVGGNDSLEGLHTLVVPLHIVHDPELEERLRAFAEGGGTVVVTSDLFQKNKDNVFLGEMPALYREWFGLGSFVSSPKPEGDPVLYRVPVGTRGGRVVMLHKDATLEEWQALFATLRR